jgi:hypothetical protein
MGWSGVPSCPWLVTESDGTPRCSRTSLREQLKVLEAARFTLFDQTFIDEAFASWQKRAPHLKAGVCSPAACPSRWVRFVNSLNARSGWPMLRSQSLH